MEYKKISRDKYNIHLINTDRFKSITVEVNFSSKLNSKSISYNKMLAKLMVYSTKKYDTKKKLSIKLEELYGTDFYIDSERFGGINNFKIGVDFLNPKYTEYSELKNNIDILYEGAFNPNVTNGKFSDNYFEIVRDTLLANIKVSNESPSSYASREFKSIFFKGTPLEYNALGEEEIYKNISSEEIYEYYKNLIENSTINILVIGDLSKKYEDFLIKEFDKKFGNMKLNGLKDLTPIFMRDFYPNIEEKKESRNISQSELLIGLNLINLNDYQKMYPLIVYNNILGMGMNSILFNKVREENSLCYSIRSAIFRFGDALAINAGISKINYEKALKVINECLELMKDRKTIEEALSDAKMEINTRINNYYDSKSMILDHYYNNEFIFEDDIETQREKINNISVDEIIEIAESVKTSVIYFLEGDKVSSND